MTQNQLHKLGQKYRQRSVELEAKYTKNVDKIYQDTLVNFLRYLGARVRKNPASTIEELLKRPDVVYNFQSFWDSAQEKVRKEVEDAYNAGALLGGEYAQEEANLLGLKVPPVETLNKSMLSALLKDVDRQMDDLEIRFHEIASAAFSERDLIRADKLRTRDDRAKFADKVGARLARHVTTATVGISSRAKKSTTTAVQRGMTDAHINSYAKSKQEGKIKWMKMWVATYVNNTPCAECTKLHGTAVAIDSEFPKGTTPIYKDLQGPPRHVNCKCILVLYPEIVEKPAPKKPKMQMDAPKISKFASLLKAIKSKIRR